MNYSSSTAALCLVALSLFACSAKRDREHSAPPSTSHTTPADAGSAAAGSTWQFAAFGDSPGEQHPYVVLKNASHLRVVAADGKTIAEFTPTDTEHVVTASVPGTFIWVEPELIHAIEIPSGRERWTRPVSGRRVIMAMDDALAVTADGSAKGSAAGPESLVIDINANRERFRQQTRASMIVGSRLLRAFVFLGESSIWMIDDATGKLLWTADIHGLDGATDDFFGGTMFVLRSDRSYAKIDTKSGRSTEGKCEEAEAAPNSCLGVPHGAEEPFSLGMFAIKAGTVAYAVLNSTPGGQTLIARDPVGNVLWRTPLGGCAMALNERVAPEHAFPSNDAVAVLVKCSKSASDEVLVLGQSDGRIRYRHVFDHAGRLVSVSDSCVLVLEGAKGELKCLDAHSGKPTWTTPAFGTEIEGASAMPLENGDVLLVDSNPLTVSRVASDGKRVWQTELPGVELSLGRDSEHGPGHLVDKATRRQWMWSQTMGVLAPARDDEETNISVLDLATGKLHQIQ